VNTNDRGPGSLRQAILDANNGRVERIILDVADNDPGHVYYRDDGVPGSLSVAARATVPDQQIRDFDPDYPGPAQSWFAIRLASPLPPIRRPVTLCSCTAGGRKVELNGQDVGPANGLNVYADRTTVSDLVINRFEGAGIFIGSGMPSSVENGAHVQLVDNYIGVDASGTMARGNLTHGVLVQGLNGNIESNVISSNGQSGVFILSPQSDPSNPDGANTADLFVTVSDNKIGTDVTGTQNLGNGRHGVQLFATGRNIVRDNVIAASGGGGAATSGRGVSIERLGGAKNEITNNVIRHNLADGITLAAARDNMILDNTIVSNRGNGVTVISGGTNSGGNRISQNRIGSNAGIGINLVGSGDRADGVTPNDPGDVDTMGDGGNGLQNYPLIDNVTVTPTGQGTFDVAVFGFMDSTKGESFTLEFFSSLGVDPTGNGEGEFFLGSTFISALDDRRHSFDFPSVFIADRQTVTATVAATGVYRVIDVDVLLDISHTFAMDLDVYLISPSGTRVLLFDRINALNLQSLIGTYLDDEAATAITAASAPFTGSFQPEGRLSDFDGEGAVGAWTLEITDRAGGDEGPLDRGVVMIKTLQSYQATFRNVPADKIGPYITATATDRFGNTSEFSAALAVPLPQRPPRITSALSVRVPENSTTVLTVTATDPDGDAVRFAINGGADRAAFAIDAATGVLSFTARPDFESPADADGNNIYEVGITAADGKEGSASSLVHVTVTDVTDTAPTVRIGAVTPTPRAGSVDMIAIVFSSAVTGLDLSDLSLTRTTGSTLSVWPGNAALVTSDNVTWTVGNLSALTADSGSYVLSLNASGSGITDHAGTPLAAGATLRWTNGAGDANGDREFNQFDVIQVLQSGKYLSAVAASWSEGDFNGDGLFNQFDIVAAQQTQPAHYRQGPFSASSARSNSTISP
jgi:parallel beta-helix repeat protein